MPKKNLILKLSSLVFLLIVFSLLKAQKTYSAVANHIVISEIQIGGSVADDEFIELYNPTGSSLDISGWSIQRETTGGTLAKKNFEAGATIPSHGFYLIANSAYDGGVTADMFHSSFNLSSTGTTVFLVNDQNQLSTGDESSIVDKVAIGSSALDSEGTTISSIPSANSSVERKPGESIPTGGNGEDTDNNSADFAERTTSDPQNTGSAAETPSTPTSTPTETTTPTETGSPTPTLEASPTATGEPSPTEFLTPTPTEVPSATPSEEPSPTVSETPTPTLTETPTLTLTPTEEPSPTVTESPTPTVTPTETTTPTPTETLTPTPTEVPSATPTEEASPTPTEEVSPTLTETPTPTLEPTPSLTPVPTPTTFQQLIGIFPFPGKTVVCSLNFTTFRIGFFVFRFPKLTCF